MSLEDELRKKVEEDINAAFGPVSSGQEAKPPAYKGKAMKAKYKMTKGKLHGGPARGKIASRYMK